VRSSRRVVILGVLATTIVFHLTASAEDINSLKGGSTSIQFLSFGGESRGLFRTSGLYMKRHLTDRTALRIGADFSVQESSGETPPSGAPGTVNNTRDYSISLVGEVTRYLDATGPVTMFVGLGPYWTRGRSFYEQWTTQTSGGTDYSYHDKNDGRYWEIGGSAALGFEWFVKRKLSVLGRVGASVGFGERHQNYAYEYSDGGIITVRSARRFDGTTAAAASSTGALGFSAYF
jgi:hypothetical protein